MCNAACVMLSVMLRGVLHVLMLPMDKALKAAVDVAQLFKDCHCYEMQQVVTSHSLCICRKGDGGSDVACLMCLLAVLRGASGAALRLCHVSGNDTDGKRHHQNHRFHAAAAAAAIL